MMRILSIGLLLFSVLISPVSAETLFTVSRHVDTTFTNADFDNAMDDVNLRLQIDNGRCNDVPCTATFGRSGNINTFGTIGDGLDTITRDTELSTVFAESGRVKVITSIDRCGGATNPSIIGCGQCPGSSFIVESTVTGEVYVHEYGHNIEIHDCSVNNGHRTDCEWNIMDNDTDGTNDAVNQAECTAFGGNIALPPTVDTFDVTPRSLTLGNAFTISYTVSDDTGLKQVELWRATDTDGDGQPNWPSTPLKTTTLSGQTSYSGSFTDKPTSANTYWYGIHVVDNAGNWNDEQNSNTGGVPGDYGPIKVTVTNPPSCPSLYFWNGSDFERRGFIFPGAMPREKEYRDHIPIKQLELKNGQYYLQIRETEPENSFIDMAKLIIVDHSPDTGSSAISISRELIPASHIRTSEILYKNKGYVAWGSNIKTLSPTSATHSVIGDVMPLLRFSDNRYVKTYPGDIITLTFPNLPLQAGKIRDFIFVGEGFYVPLENMSRPLW